MILLGIWRGRWGHGGDKKEGIEEYAYRVGRFHSLFPEKESFNTHPGCLSGRQRLQGQTTPHPKEMEEE